MITFDSDDEVTVHPSFDDIYYSHGREGNVFYEADEGVEGWYWVDEAWQATGPYPTKESAQAASDSYDWGE